MRGTTPDDQNGPTARGWRQPGPTGPGLVGQPACGQGAAGTDARSTHVRGGNAAPAAARSRGRWAVRDDRGGPVWWVSPPGPCGQAVLRGGDHRGARVDLPAGAGLDRRSDLGGARASDPRSLAGDAPVAPADRRREAGGGARIAVAAAGAGAADSGAGSPARRDWRGGAAGRVVDLDAHHDDVRLCRAVLVGPPANDPCRDAALVRDDAAGGWRPATGAA